LRIVRLYQYLLLPSLLAGMLHLLLHTLRLGWTMALRHTSKKIRRWIGIIRKHSHGRLPMLFRLSVLYKMRLSTHGCHLGNLGHARLPHDIRPSIHLSETLLRIVIEGTLGPSLDMGCRRHVGNLAKMPEKATRKQAGNGTASI
jgi:hypothetical protein